MWGKNTCGCWIYAIFSEGGRKYVAKVAFKDEVINVATKLTVAEAMDAAVKYFYEHVNEEMNSKKGK